MKNCLVIPLKEVADNDNLEYLGGVKIHFDAVTTPSMSNRVLTLSSQVEKAIIISNPQGNCYFTNFDNGTNYGDTATEGNGIIVSDTARFLEIAGTGECDIIVFSKYTLSAINCNVNNIRIDSFSYIGALTDTGTVLWLYYAGSLGALDLSSFDGAKIRSLNIIRTSPSNKVTVLKYLQNKEYLTTINYSQINVSSEEFTELCKMTELTILKMLSGQPIAGFSSTELGKLTKLTTIEINGIITSFGPLETFVAAQRANGRTTCAGISWKYAGYIGATFNGSAVAQSTSAKTLSWTADTITYDGTTISA